MKTPVHIEQHYLGIALLLCIMGYIALATTSKVQNDSTLTNLAFALAGGLAGATLPRRDSMGNNVTLNSPTDTTVNSATASDNTTAS